MADWAEVSLVEENEFVPAAGECEVFCNYKPVHLKIGTPHPQRLCEGSGIGSVSPPAITYKLRMSRKFYLPGGNTNGRYGHLSSAQLEAIVYALQSHQKYIDCSTWDGGRPVRQGFLLGDGTGIGKSRTLAGIAYEHYLGGTRKMVWVTANVGLFPIAKLEVSHFMPDLDLIDLKDLDKRSRSSSGMIFATYGTLIDNVKFGKLKGWLGTDFDGLIFFDDAHYAKAQDNSAAKASNRGAKVNALQMLYPEAKIVYSTATSASEPHHFLYMKRLGIWGPRTPYADHELFRTKFEQRGMAAFEMLAIELKMRGVFLSRQISFQNVNVFCRQIQPKSFFGPVYDRCCEMWGLLIQYVEMQKQLDLERPSTSTTEPGPKPMKNLVGPFFANALIFYSNLVMSSKLAVTGAITRTALDRTDTPQSVIIGLQSTGGTKFAAFMTEPWNKGQPFSNLGYILRHAMLSIGISLGCPKVYMKDGSITNIGNWTKADEATADRNHRIVSKKFDELREEEFEDDEDVDVTPSWNIDDLTRNRPIQRVVTPGPPKRMKTDAYHFDRWPEYSVGAYLEGEELDTPINLSWSYDRVKSNITKEGLARMYHELVPFLPINALDEIVDRVGTANCVELTGRRYFNKYDTDIDKWIVQGRPPNKHEIKAFMDLKKRVCIISSAASTGFSLHSDKSCKNQQPRVHITVQYAWGPDQLLQQLGRSHRSNQAYSPTYVILKSPIPAETRFVAVVAKRLKQLGAICQGQSQANPLASAMSDIVCSHIGVEGINTTIGAMDARPEMKKLLTLLQINKITLKRTQPQRVPVEKIAHCFNRLLMLPIQNQVTFLDAVNGEIDRLVKSGRRIYSPIVEYPSPSTSVTLVSSETIAGKNSVQFDILKFVISRVASWEFLQALGQKGQVYTRCKQFLYVVETRDGKFEAYQPHNRVPKPVSAKVLATYKVGGFIEELGWKQQVKKLEENPGCIHQSRGGCIRPGCMVQWGTYQIMLLCGFTSSLFEQLELIYSNHQFQLARVSCKDRNGIEKMSVGILVEGYRMDDVLRLFTGVKY